MKKRVLAAFLSAAMVIGLLSGCATSGNSGGSSEDSSKEDGEVTLTFLNKYPEDPYAQYFVDAVAAFEKEHPDIKIEMENVSDEAIKDKLSVMASGEQMSDIFFSWTGERVKRFARNDLVLDLTSYLKDDSAWADSFLPAFLNNATYDGKTYAIPFRSSIMYFVYNKEVFDEHKLEVPKTWDEFIAICDQLKKTDVTPIAFGNSQTWYSSWWIGLMNAMMVPADVMNKDYTPETGEFTDPAYTEAVQTFLDMNKKGYFGDNVNAKDYYEVREGFCAGKYAMMLDATAQFTQFDDGMGAENWGYFKVPVMEGAAGDPGTIGGGGEAWMISKTCKHPEEAITFLKFMTSLEQGQKQTSEAGLPNALVGGITKDNATEMLANAYKEAEGYTNIADWLDCAVEASIADQYMVSVQEGFNGKSAEDIMKDIQTAAAKVKEEAAK
ncbi:MAG: sugar ABC transporter substrate-binding protein [Dorea sp.]|jgi:raffinose/stachyose/melibiose transport system substrate-binding protein|nr:sugar ABC transporter substrate-binding protein [Dorea sp.]